MLIGLISDTHIPSTIKELPESVAEAFAGVDLILHAGDILLPETLDWLERVAPVRAATGNNDFFEDPRMEPNPIITVEGKKIGMVHHLVIPPLTLRQIFKQDVDIVVFGHTHFEMIYEKDGVLFINPGSISYPKNRMDLPGTLGFLKIENGTVEATLVSIPR